MKEEIEAITARLDQLQGIQLAQRVLLLVVAGHVAEKDFAALLDMDKAIEMQMAALRHSSASDLVLQTFQQATQELRDQLSGIKSQNLPF